jgi:hypothetical protein
VRQPEDAVVEVDEALATLRRQGITDLRVELSWPHYRDLLELKGLDVSSVSIKAWGSAYEARPLKVYRERSLKFIQHRSQVLGKNDEGYTVARPVPFKDGT